MTPARPFARLACAATPLTLALLVGLAGCGTTGEVHAAPRTYSRTWGDPPDRTTTTEPIDQPGTPVVEDRNRGEVDLGNPEDPTLLRQAYIDAILLAEGNDEVPEPFKASFDECVAPGLVDQLEPEELQEGGITPDDLAETDLVDLVPDDEAAEELVTLMEQCGMDLTALIVWGAEDGSPLSPSQRTCLDEALTPERAHQALVKTMQGENPPVAITVEIAKCLYR
jgi:hypothetical protein